MLAAVQAEAAAPVLEGIFRGSEIGQVEFRTQDGRVSGRATGGGRCGHDGRWIVDGVFEGNVLVGRVLLCQAGPACNDAFFDFLGFYDPTDRTLTAEVLVQSGCTSPGLSAPALNRGWLKLRADDRPKLAARREVLKKHEAQARTIFTDAHLLMNQDKFKEAREQYLLGLSFQDQNWAAHMGLGVAEINLGRVEQGVEMLTRARAQAERTQDQGQWLIHYNLACGYTTLGRRDQAFESLTTMYDHGFMELAELEEQKELRPLHSDPRWDQIRELARRRAKTAKNER